MNSTLADFDLPPPPPQMPPLLQSLLLVLAGVALLYGGAESLVRGSVALARLAKITPLVIGLTVVALGTSTPELVVSVQAALLGNGALAIGNVVGSNIANIGLILGLSVLIRRPRVHLQLLKVDGPVLVAVSLAFVLLLIDGRLMRWEGVLLLAAAPLYVLNNLRLARNESVSEEDVSVDAAAPSTPFAGVAFVVGGAAVLAAGAHLLVRGAVSIAEELALSQTIIGLTLVAIGTSLPELATSILASAKGHGDVAIGNVVGSNIFNILGIGGLTVVLRPISEAGIGLLDLATMTLLAVVLLPFMITGRRIGRIEGAGLLAAYGAYLAFLLT